MSAPETDPILDLAGAFDGLPPDVSENFDRYLNETYAATPRPLSDTDARDDVPRR